MTTIYYVQTLTDDKTFGETTDVDTIIENINNAGKGFKEYIDELRESTTSTCVKYFSAAGRYIVYLEIEKYWRYGKMEFNDVGDGEDTKRLAEISFKYVNDDRTLDHIQLWNKFIEMRTSMLFNENAVELRIKELKT